MIEATSVAEPYDEAETPVLVRENSSEINCKPVPAVYNVLLSAVYSHRELVLFHFKICSLAGTEELSIKRPCNPITVNCPSFAS